MKKRRPGRPKADIPKDELIQLRISSADKQVLDAKATKAGKKLSAYLREKGLAS